MAARIGQHRRESETPKGYESYMYVETIFTIRPAQPVFFIAESSQDDESFDFGIDVDEVFVDPPEESSNSDEKSEGD
jgi:hypothetical protein